MKTSSRIAALVAGAVVGLVARTLPAIIGVLARDLGFRPGMLGAFGSADRLGMAAGALSAIAVMRYASPRATSLADSCCCLLLTSDPQRSSGVRRLWRCV